MISSRASHSSHPPNSPIANAPAADPEDPETTTISPHSHLRRPMRSPTHSSTEQYPQPISRNRHKGTICLWMHPNSNRTMLQFSSNNMFLSKTISTLSQTLTPLNLPTKTRQATRQCRDWTRSRNQCVGVKLEARWVNQAKATIFGLESCPTATVSKAQGWSPPTASKTSPSR